MTKHRDFFIDKYLLKNKALTQSVQYQMVNVLKIRIFPALKFRNMPQ